MRILSTISLVALLAAGCESRPCCILTGPGAESQPGAMTQSQAPAAPSDAAGAPVPASAVTTKEPSMQLGNFSVSLAVKDLGASRAFYEKLGFTARGGDGKSWLILQNETASIGLFQGMFDKNMLTFNPGWDRNTNTLPAFTDVRDLQRELKKRGITPMLPADENSTGVAHMMLVDPDGNPILIDQHVPKPK